MRKDILLGVFFALSICPLLAQQVTQPAVNLSLGFSSAALDATKAIRQCRGTMFLTRVGLPFRPTRRRPSTAPKTQPGPHRNTRLSVF